MLLLEGFEGEKSSDFLPQFPGIVFSHQVAARPAKSAECRTPQPPLISRPDTFVTATKTAKSAVAWHIAVIVVTFQRRMCTNPGTAAT